MWNGDYNFFDYKYNIDGYNGQDYMAPIQYIMIGIGLAVAVVLIFLLRKNRKEKSKLFLGILGIFFVLLYLSKTTWESYWDITTGRGFNYYILPFDTCSIFMPALCVAGFSKKDSIMERLAATWLGTIGLVGGLSNCIFLRGLNYYPMFSFGGLYSYLWHIAMIFVALYIPISGFHFFEMKDSFYGVVFILVAAIVVIPFNYIKNADFMLINEAGGVPLIEGIASKLNAMNLTPLVNILMLVVYFILSTLFTTIYHFCFAKKESNAIKN